ncbi:MAG: hypothetical protein GKS00_02815 [Alphaproteobacteria bacterium]|nr:hypothetical protein [Alphaproteobacteria bacterium]
MMSAGGAVVFRCDAGAEDGLGHLRRCMSLADALRKRTRTARFIAANGEGQLGPQLLSQAEIPYRNAAGPVGTSADLEDLMAAEDVAASSVLVIDSKRADGDYFHMLRKKHCLAVIDDDAAQAISADLVLNARLDAAPDLYGAKSCVGAYALGGRFNLVPESLFSLPAPDPQAPIMVTMGGEDPENRTSWIVETLTARRPDVALRVVIGPAHPHPESALAAVSAHPNAQAVVAPDGLASEIHACRAAISAGGTSCYELCAARRPFAVVLLEEHQRLLAGPFFDAGAAYLANEVTDWSPDRLIDAVSRLDDPQAVAAMVSVQGTLLRESGVDAAIDALLSLERS